MTMFSALAPLAITYNGQLRMEQPDGACVIPEACAPAGSEWLAPLLVLTSTGALTLFLLIALVHLREAHLICEEERSRTCAERDAFQRFSKRVAEIDATATNSSVSVVGSGSAATIESTPMSPEIDRVRQAYRETVMATDHYEDDYGEPLLENMRAELGDEVTMAVLKGEQFTPTLRQALLEKSRQAAARRQDFLRTLDRETEELSRAEDVFTEVEEELRNEDERPLSGRSFDNLRGLWECLDDLEAECAHILRERQEEARRKPAVRGPDATTFHEYLYRTLPTNHPVLADGTRLIDQIRTAKHRVSRTLSQRV